jgi:alkylation response protein AidB-like acyl-CoA dehydrogenase
LTADEQRVNELCDDLLAKLDPKSTPAAEFLGAQYDLGLAWVHFAEGSGGLGLSPKLQNTINAKLFAAGAPVPYGRNPIGYGMCAPTLVTHGSEEQKRRYLRPLFSGEEIWCQMFSEPGAGSDVAGLSARAVRDGDEWVVNGQKVWNTLAHLADRGMLVARTDPELPKHKGLTYFMVDMHAAGVEVRPLRQITGEAEFNEVYLTDARIADADRIGDIGDGWRVSMTTLMNERTTIGAASGGGGNSKRVSGIQEALDLWSKRPAVERDAVNRDRIARLWIENEVLRYTNQRAAAKARAGNPGPEGSIAKLALANMNKATYELCVDLLGADGIVGYDYTFTRPDEAGLEAPLGSARKMFLRARANSIEGGTSEIMRNILGERILGLPGEPRVDRDLPWSQVPRS